MKVSPATNSPSMKAGIYFAKYGVLFNNNAHYVNSEGQKISSEGIRYFEDTKVPAEIKDRIKDIPLVKKLAENHDVFVNYSSNDFAKPSLTVTQLDVLHADYSKERVTKYSVEGIAKESKSAIDIAFERFNNLKANRAITGKLNFFEKFIDRVKNFK